jgi:hypothetical protein
MAFEVVVYLTITDQQSGTHLVKVNELGAFDITLLTPMRRDMGNPAIGVERRLGGRIQMEERVTVAY